MNESSDAARSAEASAVLVGPGVAAAPTAVPLGAPKTGDALSSSREKRIRVDHLDRFRGYLPNDIYAIIDAVSKLSWGLWITLTFSVRLKPEKAFVRVRRLMRYLKEQTPLRKWIAVAAPQAEGNTHVHLLVDAWFEPELVRIYSLLPMVAGDNVRSWYREKTPEVCVKVGKEFHPKYMLEHLVFNPGKAEIDMSRPMAAALRFHLGEGGAL